MTRLGDFLKFLAANSFTKVAQSFLLLGNFERDHLMLNSCGYYLGNFCKYLGNFFNRASGHTVQVLQDVVC